MTVTNNEKIDISLAINEALEWRYATKRFDPSRKISPQDWETLKKSLLFSPSSYGLQPWKFLVIENPELRKALKPLTWEQTQVTDASHFVVFTYKEKMDAEYVQRFIDRIAEVRGVSPASLEGYKDMMVDNLVNGHTGEQSSVWASRQAYIAMGFLMETAAILKIDACPIEGLLPEKYDEILKLKGTGYKTVAAVALGYRHSQDESQSRKKVRFGEKTVIETIK